MKASVIDNFKILFSDEYKVSDRDYKVLSDTLISKGVTDEDIESGLISLVKILIEDNVYFPMTLGYLKYIWESAYTKYKFTDTLTGLVKSGYISLVKMSKDSARGILGNAIDTSDTDSITDGKLIVVRDSDKLNSVFEVVRDFTDKVKRIEESFLRDLYESVSIYPKAIQDIAVRLSTRYLKDLKIKVSIESYVDEEVSESLSMIFTGTSDYSLKDKEIKKIADKYIKKLSMVKDLEVYKESSNELYLGLELDKSKDYKSLLDPIYRFISDLEINGVQ